jgi:hypothetical protein
MKVRLMCFLSSRPICWPTPLEMSRC